MTAFLVRRLLQTVVTFLVFLVLAFVMVQAQPGDYAAFYALDPRVSPESQRAISDAFGLGQPWWRQFLAYIANFIRGDLGFSFIHYPQSVASVIGERLPRTLLLFTTATVLSFYLGFWAGKLIAWRRGTIVESVATVGGVYLYTVFTPWFALLVIWAFALKLDWFPTGKFISPERWVGASVDSGGVFLMILGTAAGLSLLLALTALATARARPQWRGRVMAAVLFTSVGIAVAVWSRSGHGVLALDVLRHMVLPVLTLTAISFAGTMLLTRSSMLQTLREDYVMAATARGLPQATVRDRYVARNAMLPVVTSLVFSLAFAIDGGVLIEAVFSWPGMGMTLLEAVTREDLPLAVGAFLFVGIFALIAHIAADVLNVILDPRLRR
jgi:peptide/nickel transport system permease protein